MDDYKFYDDLGQNDPDDVDYSDTEDIDPVRALADELVDMVEGKAAQLAARARRLAPAPRQPERRSFESSDRERVICAHELARAMEEFATNQPVPLYGGQFEFQEAAEAVLELAHYQKCDLKGR